MRIVVLTLMFFTILSYGQIDANSLVSIPRATTVELDAITAPDPKIGSIAFDTTKDRLVEYTSTGWTAMLTESNIYVGAFILADPAGTSGTFTQTVATLPFQPSQITFIAHANIEVADNGATGSDNSVGNNNSGLNNSFGTMHGFARDDGGLVPTQQVIYVGGSGNSINDISRYSSNSNCIGLRYGNQNGNNLGIISAQLTSFNTNGFTIDVTRTIGTTSEELVVLYTAYK